MKCNEIIDEGWFDDTAEKWDQFKTSAQYKQKQLQYAVEARKYAPGLYRIAWLEYAAKKAASQGNSAYTNKDEFKRWVIDYFKKSPGAIAAASKVIDSL